MMQCASIQSQATHRTGKSTTYSGPVATGDDLQPAPACRRLRRALRNAVLGALVAGDPPPVCPDAGRGQAERVHLVTDERAEVHRSTGEFGESEIADVEGDFELL